MAAAAQNLVRLARGCQLLRKSKQHRDQSRDIAELAQCVGIDGACFVNQFNVVAEWWKCPLDRAAHS